MSALVRRACIDIGSNTTRLLVAQCDGERLLEVHQERAFTRIGRALSGEGTISAAKIAEVVEVVTAQLRTARSLGATDVAAVATASLRRAGNAAELVAAIRAGCGVEADVLSGEEEARLAFVGAARTLGRSPDGLLGVVDVGGGSSELIVGTAPDAISWCRSFELGSGDLEQSLRSDPPTTQELDRARERLGAAFGGVEVPRPEVAVAVGGSANSLRRLAGPLLDPPAFARSLRVLCALPAAEVARRFTLDLERVQLLPAGLLILQAASELFGRSLEIGHGGVREGVLLERGRHDG
jgi:exopolyphosphatase/guanosine-5'-triphosphate,3'-diphosphate pyrophosphatase